ncbi:Polycystic kidney disease protein 1-like 2 [Stylophora pistillata]|uniref:Polycystic kidney disease protein 1-like 2 n=1 Tax=Stylophora pistillata TaxID=50429 RepID=A0A2B4RRN8_STYPI|nr:Polycystic kidney disease protein 1-like 2 [Stylophora pistillata]
MLFTTFKEHINPLQVGLVPVLDNDPADRYRYEVTVYTARGKDTGTTANVSILVAGEDGQSAVHMLKSTSRSCLYPGGVDSFLITTPECLGSLTFIRIWHDNTGKSPSWLLSQVVIRDIDTEEKFFFLCNQWLACDQGDGQVDRLFPVAGKDELRDFMHLFKAKTSRDFSDGHLWFSIAFRPVRSRFTCVQRVSCCLSLLMCSMLVNVMWYRTPMKKQNSVIIDLGFFEFTWHEILIGIQSSLIVFPINLLIVQLFRNRGVSPKTKKKYVERTRTESSPPTQNHRKQTAVSLSDITPTAPHRGLESKRQGNVLLKNLTSIRSPVTIRQDSWDDELFCTLLESQISYSKKEMQSKEEKTKKDSLRIKSDHVGEVPDYLSSDIYFYLYKDEPRSCHRAGFFTLLYGLNFDNKQQAEWLISMFVSMAQDVLVSQPIKVIFMAVLFALLLKKPQDEDDDVINVELARDEEWLEQNLPHVQTGDAKVADTQCQRPPDKVCTVVQTLSRQENTVLVLTFL